MHRGDAGDAEFCALCASAVRTEEAATCVVWIVVFEKEMGIVLRKETQMKFTSKILAVALLAVVAGGARAATLTVSAGSVSTGGTITVTATEVGLTNGDTVHFTVTGGLGTFATSGNATVSANVASIVFTAGGTAGIGTITATDTVGANVGDTGSTTVIVNKDTLEVDISVTISVAVDVTFVNGGGPVASPQAWNLSNSSLAATISSAGTINTDIKNNAGADVSINVKETTPNLFKWSLVTAAGALTKDQFRITASGNPGSGVITVILSGAGAPQSYFAVGTPLASGATTSGNILTFETPPTVSHIDPRNVVTDVIKVVYTASVVP